MPPPFRLLAPASFFPIVLSLAVTSPLAAGEPELEFFEAKIRPVLVERCYSCHSEQAERIKGGLRVDSREGLRSGGDSGAAVVPGQPAESRLLAALRYESLEMPPDGRLPDAVIADFAQWIEMGAPDPREGAPAAPPPSEIDWNAERQAWSFQTPVPHVPPPVRQTEWPQQPIDSFILTRLEQAGMTPSATADRRTWLRRASFDLLGLPPAPADVEAFLADPAPDARERQVDQLLASPHYGERLARMWLDIARYAEDQAHIVGNDRSLCYPNAYKYREWVIAAFNSDLPYDDFLRKQLAADLLDSAAPEDLVALGFLGLGPKYYRRNAPEVMADEWEDRVDVVCRGLLGLTVACARCHDHKFDPIPTEDYYALAGVFASTEMYNRPLNETTSTDKGQAKDPQDAWHVVREGQVQDLAVYVRGDVKNLGPLVPRRFLQVLGGDEEHRFRDGSGRRELAEAIVAPHNPLTGRVLVNRIWALHFGSPLVSTPSNFGRLGEPPTHPELLDDLAARLSHSGWSLKRLQRELVLSATYQQSGSAPAGQESLDPANRYYGRMNRRRLSVEAWRDAVLAASGALDTRIGGPSIEPQQPEERRRTVYSRVSRLELDKLLALFDFPDPNVHCERRSETTTPLQKLFVLNSPFMACQAERLAEQVLAAAEDDLARIAWAYRAVFARPPLREELQLAQAFLQVHSGPDSAAAHRQRWSEFAQVLLASNELLLLD